MSVICQTFVQNAWRSDLCSNCFKCREDHNSSSSPCDRILPSSQHRYMPQATSLYQSRGISTSLKWRLSEPIYERVARRDFGSQTLTKASFLVEPRTEERTSRGILVTKHQDKKRRSRSSVDFASEEALVIGYGGNDYDSDQSPWEMGSDDGSVDLDLLDDNDDDRKITRMTKTNTEFNSYNRNLTAPPPTKDDESSSRQKKNENKRNSINNNNNKASSPLKTPDRTLDILTYNDIQKKPPEKKLNQYYFPSSTEQLSFLHGGNKIVNVNEKTSNHSVSNTKVDNCKSNENSSRNLLRDEFTPLNTKTYSFVSELNKNVNLSSEHSSDSDYSTCRLTAGDSTDSESFQDAEESRILPCSSFLHGNFPPQQKVLLQQSLSSLESDKKYDAGSSTSGDVSNLSDDSDASERTSYKSKNARSPKGSPTDSNKPVKEVTFSVTPSASEKTTPIVTNTNQSDIKVISGEISEKTPVSKQKVVETSPNANEKNRVPEANISQNAPSHKKTETISITVDSKYNSKTQDMKTNHSPPPNPPVDVNLRNIIAINGSSTNTKENVIPNGHSILTKTKSSPPRVPKLPEKPEIMRTKSLDSVPDQEQKSQNSNYNQIISQPKPNVDEYFYKEPSDDDDYEKSPEAINNRQSKLAALALELELARRDSAMKSKTPQPSLPPVPPPDTKSPPQIEENYPTIKKGSAISCTSRLNILPDVLQETPPTKTKKGRFSLKKLLKRNKDSGTFFPATKESNPKAWKKQTFDRSRLSLEIVHPMDLMGTSGESTQSEEGGGGYSVSCHPGKGIFKGGYSSRARSLSALPQAEYQQEQGNCSLLECRRTDTLPAVRKAGTVAERKKNRPSLVRTPSCSAIPSRPASQHPTNPGAPPPKPPPPPPKHKVAHPPPPPPPPHHLRAKAPATPQRPPPPKIPEGKCRTPSGDSTKQDSDKEYANLGDIRSLLTPAKPHRPSAPSAPHVREGCETTTTDDHYDTLQPPPHEEDHYTYVDDVTEVCASSPKKSSSCSSIASSSFSQQQGDNRGRRPWLDLQTSYAAIAAANYESLTEIIATSLNETVEYFRNAGKTLKWRDFTLEAEVPQVVLHNRWIYNAIHKLQEKEKIMLMVSPRKQCTAPRTHPRFPVLATFYDHVPTTTATSSAHWSTVHVLRRSRILTVSQFAQESARDGGNQHVHLRDHCFLMLQVIHALKGLQADGVEEVDCDVLRAMTVGVAREDAPPVFVLLPEDEDALREGNRKTLCQATLDTLLHLLQVGSAEDLSSCKVNGEGLLEPVAHTFRAIARALAEEKASSLSQAKGLLEYMLWGPVDLRECDPPADDTVLQRWLDLQRAQMVKSTITQLQNNSALHVYEEYQLVFLLQASVKSLKAIISKL